MEAAVSRSNHLRLALWTLLIVLTATVAYSERGAHSNESIYSFSTFTGGVVQYAIWLGLVLLIVIDRFDLLALRPPESWRRALAFAGVAIVVILVFDVGAALLPLPQSPGKEQNLSPTHWEPAHAGAFAANVVLFALVAPFAEELIFRGAGQSLLRVLGRVPSIVLVGVAFGAAHGLLEGLIVLIPFGIALAWLRDRTESVLPGMLIHALFNGGTLAIAVLTAPR